MFYSAELLTLKNHTGLGIVWLAATLGPKSNTKKLSRRDFSSVDIIETCRFLENPPEPMSLRLSSSLMVGVSRIYGQLWSSYYIDVNQFLANMKDFKKAKSVNMEVEKVPVESITVAPSRTLPPEMNLTDPLAMLDMDGLDLNGFLESLALNTPEQVRRSAISASSASRERPSIDIGRGILSDMKKTSLSGAEPMIGTQFEANNEDMAFYGFGDDDFGGFMPSGPETSSGIESFFRGKGSSPVSGLVLEGVPGEIAGPKLTRHKRKVSGSFEKMFDEETMLEKEGLLLGPGEGLDDDDLEKREQVPFKNFMSSALVGVGLGDLFGGLGQRAAEVPKRAVRLASALRSSDYPSSEHYVPMMDDDYGYDASDPARDFGAGFMSLERNSATSKTSEPKHDVHEALRRLSDVIPKSKTCQFQKLLEGKFPTRHEASKAFYDVLAMACRGSIRLSQRSPYGPINIQMC